MLAPCLRRWINIIPALTHVSGEMWWSVSATFPVSYSASRHVLFNAGPASWIVALHQSSTHARGQTWVKQKKSFLKVPTPIDGFDTDSARPRSTTSGEASLVWEDGKIHLPVFNSVPDRHPVSQLSKSNTTADVYRPAIGLLQVHSTSTHNAAWCAHDKYKNQTFLFWTYIAYILILHTLRALTCRDFVPIHVFN